MVVCLFFLLDSYLDFELKLIELREPSLSKRIQKYLTFANFTKTSDRMNTLLGASAFLKEPVGNS